MVDLLLLTRPAHDVKVLGDGIVDLQYWRLVVPMEVPGVQPLRLLESESFSDKVVPIFDLSAAQIYPNMSGCGDC